MALYLFKKHTALSLREIGSLFGVDHTSVSASAKRFDEKMKRDKKTKEIVERAMERQER